MEGFGKETRVETENILLILYMSTYGNWEVPVVSGLFCYSTYTADDFFPMYLLVRQKKPQRMRLKGITNLHQHDAALHILIALGILFKRL